MEWMKASELKLILIKAEVLLVNAVCRASLSWKQQVCNLEALLDPGLQLKAQISSFYQFQLF